MMSNSSSIRKTPVVIDTSQSPFVQMEQVPLDSVVLKDNFWLPRQIINKKVMLPAQYELCEKTGRVDNFRRASGRRIIEYQGLYFNDSDVYKWLEASSWALIGGSDPELEKMMDNIIEQIAAAQSPDGYINTYFIFERANERWTDFDLHELYCAGHLIQAAIAHHRVTTKITLLEVARRFADHIYDHFLVEKGQIEFNTSGHPEIEMALVEFYRLTGEKKYLLLSQYFVDNRGSGRLRKALINKNDATYYQDHKPFRELTKLDGHAVRAIYLNCGAADLVAETGEKAMMTALNRLWHNMSTCQMYINGGLGSRYENEGFGENHELPNERAHTETCASVANFMWNWRMLMLNADARYVDIMELALYNSILSGVSLNGQEYFYQNPLLDNGSHRRVKWFTVACCPSNYSRLLSSLPSYIYSLSSEGVWVHLYIGSQASFLLPDSQEVSLIQSTNYPWDDRIEFEIKSAGKFSLFLRLPGWCNKGWSVKLNGDPVPYKLTNMGYIQIEYDWKIGDKVELLLPMSIKCIESHPNVVENQGRVALMRGPILYCVEGVDHLPFDVRHFVLTNPENIITEYNADLLGGVNVLQGKVKILEKDENWDNKLYREYSFPLEEQYGRTVDMMAIPYFAWANREPGPMLVWLRKMKN